jgi:hypothetical protein
MRGVGDMLPSCNVSLIRLTPSSPGHNDHIPYGAGAPPHPSFRAGQDTPCRSITITSIGGPTCFDPPSMTSRTINGAPELAGNKRSSPCSAMYRSIGRRSPRKKYSTPVGQSPGHVIRIAVILMRPPVSSNARNDIPIKTGRSPSYAASRIEVMVPSCSSSNFP